MSDSSRERTRDSRQELDVLILCGGKGTRAYPDTLDVPKPLLPVAGVPVVEHVMGVYAAQGFTRFVLAAGYRGDLLADHFAGSIRWPDVHVVDTGLDTDTGERIRLAAPHTTGDRFFATYADGLGDVDLHAVLTTHCRKRALATVTTVPLRSQYGTVVSDRGGRITEFKEKPVLDGHWINAGYFVFERAALEHWSGLNLEQETLPALASRGELYAYRHQGFWKSMDTYKDRQELDALANAGTPPWQMEPRTTVRSGP